MAGRGEFPKKGKVAAADKKITKIQKELDEVKVIMAENIEKVIARGEAIEVLVDKSAQLAKDAEVYHHKTRTPLQKFCFWLSCSGKCSGKPERRPLRIRQIN